MTVQITNHSPVPVHVYRNMIRIEANYMHGDLNGSSTEAVMYQRDEASEIHFDIEGLAFLKSIGTGQYGITTEDAKERVREFFAANNNFHREQDTVEDFIEQFVIQDDQDDSYEYAATLQTVDVYLFDEDGVKYQMNVKVNGKPIND